MTLSQIVEKYRSCAEPIIEKKSKENLLKRSSILKN